MYYMHAVTRELGVSDIIINHGGFINLQGILLASHNKASATFQTSQSWTQLSEVLTVQPAQLHPLHDQAFRSLSCTCHTHTQTPLSCRNTMGIKGEVDGGFPKAQPAFTILVCSEASSCFSSCPAS